MMWAIYKIKSINIVKKVILMHAFIFKLLSDNEYNTTLNTLSLVQKRFCFDFPNFFILQLLIILTQN